MLCLASPCLCYATTLRERVDKLNKVALQIGVGVSIVLLTIRDVCRGPWHKERRRSASPCQCVPPQTIGMLRYIPEQLYRLFGELLLLFCHCD